MNQYTLKDLKDLKNIVSNKCLSNKSNGLLDPFYTALNKILIDYLCSPVRFYFYDSDIAEGIECCIRNSWKDTIHKHFEKGKYKLPPHDKNILYKLIYEYSLTDLIPFLNTEYEPLVHWRHSLLERQK
jgi:hypothetical protein